MSATWLSLALLGLLGAPVETQATAETLLYVRTSPPGAKLLLDGKPLGTSDDLFAVEPGVRRIVIELEGHGPQAKELTIRAGEVTRIELELKKVAGANAELEKESWSVHGDFQCRLQAERRSWECWEMPRMTLHVRNTGDAYAALDTVYLYFDSCLCPVAQMQPPMKIPPGKQIQVPIDLGNRLGGNPSTATGLHSGYVALGNKGFNFLNSKKITVEMLPPGATSPAEVERALNTYQVDGAKVAAGFLPYKRELLQGEPLYMTLVAKNLGEKSVQVCNFADAQYGKHPPQQFFDGKRFDEAQRPTITVTATDSEGNPVPQLKPPDGLHAPWGGPAGGRPMKVEIMPGDTTSRSLALADALVLEKPGKYDVTCRLSDLDGKGAAVETRFKLIIHPPTDEFVGPLMKEIQERLRRNEGKPTGDVLATLVNVDNPLVLPALAPLLLSADRDVSRNALGALARFARLPPADFDGAVFFRRDKTASFYLEKTVLVDEDFACLKDLPKLHLLSLPGAATDAGLTRLQGLSGLEYLLLDRTKITDEGLKQVARFKRIRFLHLRGTNVTDAGLAHLKELTELQGLYLDGTRVAGSGLVHLKELKHLFDLRLDNTLLDDAGAEHLAALGNLSGLSLRGTKITDAGLEKLRRALPKTKVSR